MKLFVFLVLPVFLVAGCGGLQPKFVAKHEPWRATEEQACLSSGIARRNPYVQPRASLGGPAPCGALQPFRMSATRDGRVSLNPPALLRCPMIPAIEHWIETVVDPAARRYFGVPIVEVKVAASFACRPINHVKGGRLSEHGHANALDVSGFRLVDGRKIGVKAGWLSEGPQRSFLRAVHRGACQTFTTVLGPNYDRHHRDHFHLDLALRRSGAVCK